jgi:nascent polypeptide-associated complex subunit alpha
MELLGLVKMFPNINPKQMQKMMNKMGMKQEEIPASEVIIKSSGKDIIIKNPQVLKVNMMGKDTFQISGDVSEGTGISKDDVLTVANQADVSEEEALKALEKNKGDLADAIMDLKK